MADNRVIWNACCLVGKGGRVLSRGLGVFANELRPASRGAVAPEGGWFGNGNGNQRLGRTFVLLGMALGVGGCAGGFRSLGFPGAQGGVKPGWLLA